MTPISGFNTAANRAQCWIYRARRPVENNLEAIRNLIAETRDLIQENEIDRIDGLSIWKIQESYELIAAVIQLRDGLEVDAYQLGKLERDIGCLAEFPFTNAFEPETISDLPEPLSILSQFYTQLRDLYLQELSNILGRPVQIPTPRPAPSAATPLPIRLFYEAEPAIIIPLERPRATGRMPTERCLWNQTRGYSMLSGENGAVSRINNTQDIVLENLHDAIQKLISQTQQLIQNLDLDMIEYLSIWKIQENYELIAKTIQLIKDGCQLDEDQINKLAMDILSLAEHSLTHAANSNLPATVSHLEELYTHLRDLYLRQLFKISQRLVKNPAPQSLSNREPEVKIAFVQSNAIRRTEPCLWGQYDNRWLPMMHAETKITGMQSALERINNAIRKILEMLIASVVRAYRNINKISSKGE